MERFRGLKPLFLATLFRGIGSTVIRVFLPVYALTIGMDINDIGFAVTLATAISVLVLPIMGYLADVVSRKLALIISTTFLAIAALLPMLYSMRLLILIAFILFYVSFLSWQPARGALVAGESPTGTLGKTFALLSLAFWIPRTITPYIAGIIIAYLGYKYAFLISLLSSAIAVFALTLLREERGNNRVQAVSLSEVLKGIIPTRKEIPLHVILSLDRIGWMLWLPLLNPFMKAELHLNEDDIGLLNTIMNIATILVLIPSGRIVDSYGWRIGLLLSELSVIIGLIPLILVPSIYCIVILMTGIGISIGLWLPSFNTAIPSIVNNHAEMGRGYSRVNIYRVIASVPSPWIGGALYTILSTCPLILGCMLLTINAILIALNPWKKQ